MSKADEALADVRGWLCDNLSDGNAGMVCGMLSVVSRHINELEAENDKLRELLRKLGHFEKFGCHKCPYEERCAKSVYDVDCSMSLEIEKEMRELGIEVNE